MRIFTIFIALVFSVIGCTGAPSAKASGPAADEAINPSAMDAIPNDAASLVVAGGCFWCVESDIEHHPAVYEAISGFSGGEDKNATYRNHDGHREAVEIFYDPDAASYAELIHYFLRRIDPTDPGGQFCDRGHAYTTAIYYRNEAEKTAAQRALSEASSTLQAEISTDLEAFKFFVAADEYHQNYYRSDDKIPTRYGLLAKRDAYKRYRKGCGRDARVQEVWGSAESVSEVLTR